MINQEAHNIFVLCHHLLGKPAHQVYSERPAPSDETVKEALVYLAERAYSHLHAGYSGAKVSALWEQREADPPAQFTNDLVERLREQLDLVERLRGQLDIVLSGIHFQATEIREVLDGQGIEITHELERSLYLLDEIADARRCRSCGCTEHSACGDDEHGPCGWAGTDLCTACVSP